MSNMLHGAPTTVGSAVVSRALAHARPGGRNLEVPAARSAPGPGQGVWSPRFNAVVAMRSRRNQIVRDAIRARAESEARIRHFRCLDNRGTAREVHAAAANELVVVRATPEVRKKAVEGPGSDLFRFAPIDAPLNRALDQDDDGDDLLRLGRGLEHAAGL